MRWSELEKKKNVQVHLFFFWNSVSWFQWAIEVEEWISTIWTQALLLRALVVVVFCLLGVELFVSSCTCCHSVFFFFCTSVFHKLTGSFSSPQTNTRDDSVSFLLKIIFRGIVCRRAVSCWHISLSPLCRATSQPMVFSEQPIRIFSLFLFFFLFLSFSETSFIVVDLPLRYKKAGKACFSFFLWLSRPLRLYFSISESLRFTAFSDFHLISERL